jgi:signal transduction histidine kinase
MVIGEQVFGMLALYHDTKEYVYSSEDVTVVQSLADLGAILLENSRLYREIRSEAIAAKQLATLGTAMALIQHRINNSFNLISPNVRRLRKRVDPKDETATEILDIIDRNADYGSKMIDEIQEKLRNVEEKQPVDINQLFDEILSESLHRWQADPQNGTIQIERHLAEGIPKISAPIVQIDELLTNLIDNAYRAMNGKGKLVVSTQLSNNNVIIRVQDGGKGIPGEVLERLFKKPIAKSTIEKTDGGTGLGLWLNSLSLGTIGGTIDVESTGKEGTIFRVKIPIQ